MKTQPSNRKDFLPQDKRLRLLVQIVIVAIGLYAIVTGIKQMQSGVDEASGGAPLVQPAP